MSPVLKLLASNREARREVAMIKLAAARRAFDEAYAACEGAMAELQAAKQWREELLAQCALGAQQAVRESLLPACEALLSQRAKRFLQTQADLKAADAHMAAQRQAVLQCERDVLRLQEWQGLRRAESLRHAARQEEAEQDELARPGATGGTSP